MARFEVPCVDATEIPRSKKMGGTAQKAKLIGEGQRFVY